MARLTYVPIDSGDPAETYWQRRRFKANVPVEITDPRLITSAKGNKWFRVEDASAVAEPTPPVAAKPAAPPKAKPAPSTATAAAPKPAAKAAAPAPKPAPAPVVDDDEPLPEGLIEVEATFDEHEGKPEFIPGKHVPESSQEYRAHLVHWLKACNEAGTLANRWSKEERLRIACGVGTDDYDYLASLINPRYADLRKQAAADAAAKQG